MGLNVILVGIFGGRIEMIEMIELVYADFIINAIGIGGMVMMLWMSISPSLGLFKRSEYKKRADELRRNRND